MTEPQKERKPKPEFAPEPISRREFILRAGATGAAILGTAGAAGLLWNPKHRVPGFQEKSGIQLPDYRVAADAGKPSMVVVHGTDRKIVIKAAFDELGGIERFIKKGDRVLLKPNVAFDRPPSLAATTHPETLKAVAELVMAAGASKVFLADNPINSPTGCFLKSGITQVANDLNLDLLYPEPSMFAQLTLDGEILRNWPMFHGAFRYADKVIGVAPCKDHNLCHASMTMKNWYGMLAGRRNQFHQHIHSIVADFALMMKPTLVILDGMNVLMSNGPTGGRLSDVKPMNTIVAGTDMVAVDSYGYTHLMGRNTDELTYLHKATARGLGNMDWKSYNPKEVQA